MKKQLFFCLLLSVICITSVHSVRAEMPGASDIIMLKSNEFGHFQRSPVLFDHTMHEKLYRCNECHHNNDLFLDNETRKSALCSTCHKVEKTAEVDVALMDAFHMTCKGCHEKNLKRNRKAGPVMCGSCHRR